MRSDLWNVARQPHLDAARLAGDYLVDDLRAAVLVDDGPGACGRALEIEATIFDELLHLARFQVVAEQGYRTVAVGEEVDPAADPHGVEVVGILARNGGNAGVG